METKIPTKILKPRIAKEVPRSEYSNAPKLKSNDESARRSFIAMLRKGPGQKSGHVKRPVAIKIDSAIWLSLNKPISTCVSFVVHCRERKEDYCLILDEANPKDAESLMLSGSTIIHPGSDIEFVRLSYCGIPEDYHVFIKDIHMECKIETELQELSKLG